MLPVRSSKNDYIANLHGVNKVKMKEYQIEVLKFYTEIGIVFINTIEEQKENYQ